MRPLCRYCGKNIPRKASHVYMSTEERRKPDAPRTKAEAQRLFNEIVTAATIDNGTVARVTLWDGESYIDAHFCKDSCAQFFGRMIAKHDDTVSTVTYFEALKKQKEKQT